MTEKINKDNIIFLIKEALPIYSNMGLELDLEGFTNKQEYSGEDLFHAINLLMHIFGNIAIANHLKKGLPQDKVELIVIELAKNFKQTIELGTGIDLPSLTQRIFNKE